MAATWLGVKFWPMSGGSPALQPWDGNGRSVVEVLKSNEVVMKRPKPLPTWRSSGLRNGFSPAEVSADQGSV